MVDKVSVVGHVAYDFIHSIPFFPNKNSSIYIEDYKFSYGGGAANIAVGIKKLGGKAELISAVGEDFGDYEEYLKKIGVELRLCRMKGKTARALIFNNEKMDQITYFYWGVADKIGEERAVERDVLHLAAGDARFNLKMAQLCDFVAFDPGQDLPKYGARELELLIKKADILFCNHWELSKIADTVKTTIEEILEMAGTAIITYGMEGSILYSIHSKEKIKIPVVKSKMVDPTGAGDAYRAGFWAGKSKGYDDEISCKLGATNASFVVEKIGAQTGLPIWDALLERYEGFFDEL